MMGLILLLLVMTMLFSPLMIPLLMALAFLLIIMMPLRFAFQSLSVLILAPKQLYQAATNPILRKNHALEHATINVLEEKYRRRLPLGGFADNHGFYLRGNIEPEQVFHAAQEGLRRIQSGEKDLAIHQRCGTTLLAANIVSALIFILLFVKTAFFNIWMILMAVILANVFGPSVGVILQKTFTTSTNLDNVIITGLEYRSPPNQPAGNWLFVAIRQLRVV